MAPALAKQASGPAHSNTLTGTPFKLCLGGVFFGGYSPCQN